MMVVPRGDKTVFFDVDNTLVMWGNPHLERAKEIGGYWLVPHVRHIDALKNHKEDGCTIVVWSQGGADWAECVVVALGLEAYVDICICKPDVFYDDLSFEEFMSPHQRRYLDE